VYCGQSEVTSRYPHRRLPTTEKPAVGSIQFWLTGRERVHSLHRKKRVIADHDALSRHTRSLNPWNIQLAFIPQLEETGSQEQILFPVRELSNEYFSWKIWLKNIYTNPHVRQLRHDVQQFLLHWGPLQ
jgi:hypothetical protein